jgi:hypothetical protein
MSLWAHAALCVSVPAFWGVFMYFAFSFVGKRRKVRDEDDPPPIDYSI